MEKIILRFISETEMKKDGQAGEIEVNAEGKAIEPLKWDIKSSEERINRKDQIEVTFLETFYCNIRLKLVKIEIPEKGYVWPV